MHNKWSHIFRIHYILLGYALLIYFQLRIKFFGWSSVKHLLLNHTGKRDHSKFTDLKKAVDFAETYYFVSGQCVPATITLNLLMKWHGLQSHIVWSFDNLPYGFAHVAVYND